MGLEGALEYRGFRIEERSGKLGISPVTATARAALIGGYGLGRSNGVTFKSIGSVDKVKAVIRRLCEGQDQLMEQQAGLTRRALRSSGIGSRR